MSLARLVASRGCFQFSIIIRPTTAATTPAAREKVGAKGEQQEASTASVHGASRPRREATLLLNERQRGPALRQASLLDRQPLIYSGGNKDGGTQNYCCAESRPCWKSTDMP